MSNEIKTRSLTPTEQKYTYAQSMQLEGQTGTIGHLRGDFATTGYIALDKYDKNIVINALNTLRTRQLQEERPTEPVDELISKVAHAPTKKVKVVHCRCNEER